MAEQLALMDPIFETGASFDGPRTYRFALWRVWDDAVGRVNFVMLNPSTADEEKNDPTIARCEAFARAWGYGGIVVTNLFALRSTDPRALRQHPNPEGPGNNRFISNYAATSALVVVAWGNHGALMHRGDLVDHLVRLVRPGRPPVCFGQNKSGQPVHPLYQRSDTELRPYLRGEP